MKKTTKTTAHAIVIVDENKGDTENETPTRARTNIMKPQKAKTTIKQEEEEVEETASSSSSCCTPSSSSSLSTSWSFNGVLFLARWTCASWHKKPGGRWPPLLS